MTFPVRPLRVLALTALLLGACTARDEARSVAASPRYASLDAIADGRPPASADPGRPATPMVVLPDWAGRPVRLRERDGADAFEQTVSLSPAPRGAGGENGVLLRLPRGGASGDAGTAGGRPTEAGIRAELAAAFPGTAMRVVTRPAANAYGPYGLAVGRTAGGARCLYAWQWIAAAPDLDPASGRPGPASVRVRLCRDEITLEAMAASINQIKLVPRRAGTPVSGPSAARRAPAAARPHTAARMPATARDPDPVARSPIAATGLPPGRRYLGVPEVPDGGRELRDAGPAALRQASIGAPPTIQAEAGGADLPPEALRGPVARTGARP
ncbi:cellulose biosynthesis protein BcsN [Methylobacterium sp. C33D]